MYDLGIDFEHSDFIEYDSAGLNIERRMQGKEYFGHDYHVIDSIKKTDHSGNHGSNVAGILGGNGNNSEYHIYRGIAPKVHFFTGDAELAQYAQVGHVVNHSHISSYDGFYHNNDFSMDAAIFKNWKSECSKINPDSSMSVTNCVEGDSLTKTVVFAAANNGGLNSQYGIQRGFYSILANSKNAITVGNMTSKEKVRFHHSSMGPTWDGRIKPDIMAPGATSQLAAQLNDTIEILIDYVKMYHNDNVLYFEQNFGDGNPNTNVEYTSCVPHIVELQEGKVLKCSESFKSLKEMVIGWPLDPSGTVFPTDTIEIRLKKGNGWNDFAYVYGNINFWENGRHNKIPAVWSADTAFMISKIPFNGLNSNIKADLVRLDFSFIWGIIAPTECKGDSCGYDFLSEGGSSESAPFVSGIAALMYQKFRDTTGDSLHKHSMRNSTVKALMIHTAVDMEDSPAAHFSSNPDLLAAHHDGLAHYTPYGEGPDFATGWGYIDGKAALDMISDYNKNTKEFARFREIEIGNGVEKRWTTVVSSGKDHLRITLVWDDAPGNREYATDTHRFKEPKLVNDLDMYLVSPSGQYFYPWRLDTLPTGFIDTSGNVSLVATGYENIHESDVHDAYNGCSVGNLVGPECFDHLNNVEVVDVDNPEPGVWQIVVLGRNVSEFNNADSNAQVATLVSDSALSANEHCSVVHNYAPQTDYRCTYALGNDAISYVTFDERTYVGAGDYIELFDESGTLLGTYTENQLAGKRLKLSAKSLIVELHSDNDNSQGWGFDITKIKVYPKSVLKMPFEFTKNVGGNP